MVSQSGHTILLFHQLCCPASLSALGIVKIKKKKKNVLTSSNRYVVGYHHGFHLHFANGH